VGEVSVLEFLDRAVKLVAGIPTLIVPITTIVAVVAVVATSIPVIAAAVLNVATGVLIVATGVVIVPPEDSVFVAAILVLVAGTVVVIAVIVPSRSLATARQIEGMRWRGRSAQQRDQQPEGEQPAIRSHSGFLLGARRVVDDDTATDALAPPQTLLGRIGCFGSGRARNAKIDMRLASKECALA
jgi:hypothetical protein